MAEQPAPITPVPVPAAAAGVLLFGGTFDPPHRAHVDLAAKAREAVMPGAWLVFVPAARSPLKAAGPVASDADRVEMLRLAAMGIPRAAVWTDEIDRARAGAGPSYWVDTLRRARSVLPEGTDLRFLIGADQAADFHRWREFRQILALARPVVLPREPIATREALAGALAEAGAWREDEIGDWLAAMVDVPVVPISATQLRAHLAGGSGDAALAALPPGVREYIARRGLYAHGAGAG